MAVGTDHQHFSLFFFHNPDNFPAPADITQSGYGLKVVCLPVIPDIYSVFPGRFGFQVIALFSQHTGRGAFHDMHQDISAVYSSLADGKRQQLFIMSAEIKGNGDLLEFRNFEFN